jgi:hypothetical protein
VKENKPERLDHASSEVTKSIGQRSSRPWRHIPSRVGDIIQESRAALSRYHGRPRRNWQNGSGAVDSKKVISGKSEDNEDHGIRDEMAKSSVKARARPSLKGLLERVNALESAVKRLEYLLRDHTTKITSISENKYLTQRTAENHDVKKRLDVVVLAVTELSKRAGIYKDGFLATLPLDDKSSGPLKSLAGQVAESGVTGPALPGSVESSK